MFTTILNRLKRLHVSKTVWFGLLVAILGYVQGARADIEALIAAVHMDWIRPFVWPVVGASIVVLRFITTKPLDQK